MGLFDRDADSRAGIEAGRQARQETLDACRRLKIDAPYVMRNLKRLSRFRGSKPFVTRIGIIYSKPLDYPAIQLGALKEIAAILEMYPRAGEETTGADRLSELADILFAGPVSPASDDGTGSDDSAD